MKKLLIFILAISFSQLIMAQCNELFISEYVEGTGNNKAAEIYNPTANPIDLSDYKIQRYSNGSGSLSDELSLSGTIQPYDVWVIANGQTTSGPTSPACDPALQAMADQLGNNYPDPFYMNGNDAIVLYKISTSSIVDIFGHTNDPNMQTEDGWGPLGGYEYWTVNHVLIRKNTVTQGVTVNPTPTFDPSLEWDSLPVDTWTELGQHTCDCYVSIEEKENTAFQFSLFPNPSSSSFVFVNTNESINSIEILNMLGEVVYFVELSGNIMSYRIDYPQSISEGMYFVKVVTTSKKTKTQKLIVR
jgi:hypothetical protein